MNNELSLEDLSADHPCLDLVTGWVHDEWGKEIPQSFSDTRSDLLEQPECPATFVAFKNEIPAGLVGFRRHPVTGSIKQGLWLNILYVEQEHRRQGIASSLIAIAEKRATEYESMLFVYTTFPELYEKLGWQEFRKANKEGSFVLTRKLKKV